jgi:hypothetical protein
MLQFQGLYKGTFIIQTFSVHFSVIHRACKILGIDGLDLETAKPQGALMLSIAAVHSISFVSILLHDFSPHA